MSADTAAASSSTLWATTSKNWVIPPRPRPGRKPKQDTQPAIQAPEDADKIDGGRRVQNRAAQRAFRERKQSQLAELQARLQAYEQGEIERNVALQNIAKRLKEENEGLRRDNIALKEQVATLEHQISLTVNSQRNDKKRWREPSIDAVSCPPQKKNRVDDSDCAESPFQIASPPSMASSPSSSGASSDRPFSPIQPDVTPSRPAKFGDTVDLPGAPPNNYDQPDFFYCGFCSQDTTCVCREVMLSQQVTNSMSFKSEAYEPNPLLAIDPHVPSILDNLPAYQPPVPLRRKSAKRKAAPVFPVAPISQTDACSGDPRNCSACADDTFGKAFCEAISKSVATLPSCSDCPSNTVNPSPVNGSHLSTQATGPPQPPPAAETIPTNDAWQQLKSHPNVSFTDLSLLADVVARRSKCTGPRVALSPSPAPPETEPTALLAHAHHRSSPPRLVPQDVLIRCRQQKVREVQADGVREALRILDAKFSH